MRRLGSELQRQAQVVDQLNASSHGCSCSAKQLQQLQEGLRRLDLQSSELTTQVQAESQAQQLLKRLSGRAALVCTQHAKLCSLWSCRYNTFVYWVRELCSWKTVQSNWEWLLSIQLTDVFLQESHLLAGFST